MILRNSDAWIIFCLFISKLTTETKAKFHEKMKSMCLAQFLLDLSKLGLKILAKYFILALKEILIIEQKHFILWLIKHFTFEEQTVNVSKCQKKFRKTCLVVGQPLEVQHLKLLM